MTLPLCKKNALYVKTCVIQNGVEDSQGDTLYSEDIKRIFTSFNNQNNFELYHNNIPVSEVSLLENYISKTDETIGTTTVPRGSWNVVIRVDNPEIQELILNNTFGGVSLNNDVRSECAGNLHGVVRYQDLSSTECVIPTFISFVEKGANGVGLHVMDYEVYIMKSKKILENRESENMDLLGELKQLIQRADNSEPEIKKELVEEDKKEEDKKEENNSEGSEQKEDKTQKEPEKETEEKPEEKKSDSDVENRLTQLEEKMDKIISLMTPEDSEDKKDENKSEEPIITKSAKVIVPETEKRNNKTFYEMSNRDPLTGKKIKNGSKILN